MKVFGVLITCAFAAVALAVSPVYAQSERPLTTNTEHVGWKCKAEGQQHVCPACHSHFGFDNYGKSSSHGHYVRDCSGCAGKSVAGCAKNCGKTKS